MRAFAILSRVFDRPINRHGRGEWCLNCTTPRTEGIVSDAAALGDHSIEYKTQPLRRTISSFGYDDVLENARFDKIAIKSLYKLVVLATRLYFGQEEDTHVTD